MWACGLVFGPHFITLSRFQNRFAKVASFPEGCSVHSSNLGFVVPESGAEPSLQHPYSVGRRKGTPSGVHVVEKGCTHTKIRSVRIPYGPCT
jgi:hypothetical protein